MTAAVKETAPSPTPKSAAPRRRAIHVDWTLVLVLLAALATAYGLFLDRSLRTDPFGPPRSPWEWLTTRQPARELATIEVVPMGARGERSWRPQVTDWLFKDSGELVKRPTGTRGADGSSVGGQDRCFAP